jgi:hypothetical protein
VLADVELPVRRVQEVLDHLPKAREGMRGDAFVLVQQRQSRIKSLGNQAFVLSSHLIVDLQIGGQNEKLHRGLGGLQEWETVRAVRPVSGGHPTRCRSCIARSGSSMPHTCY